jgi:hypothetical protein
MIHLRRNLLDFEVTLNGISCGALHRLIELLTPGFNDIHLPLFSSPKQKD